MMVGHRLPLTALPAPALAQAGPAWPTRPVTAIVAYPAGGANGIVARTVAEPVRAVLGRPIVAESRGPGGARTFGAAQTAVPIGSPPEAFGARMRKDVERCARLARSAGLNLG